MHTYTQAEALYLVHTAAVRGWQAGFDSGLLKDAPGPDGLAAMQHHIVANLEREGALRTDASNTGKEGE